MQITFLGAAETVTGSCYLVQHQVDNQEINFLVDCGMFQGGKALKDRNYGELAFDASKLDFVLLTHAHIDHSGMLPKLCKKGFSGPIYATRGTAELCSILLPDSGHIQETECARKNRKNERSGKPLIEPIYTMDEAIAMQGQFKSIDYLQELEPAPGLKVTFFDAGHILGSAIIAIEYRANGQTETLVFSGDLGRNDHYILNDPTIMSKADYVLIESTYGTRNHQDEDDAKKVIINAVQETFRRGGNVVIPAFAIERTQDLLMILITAIENQQIPPGCICVDSPLAAEATDIFCKYPEYIDAETKAIYEKYGECPFKRYNIQFSLTTEESIALNNNRAPKIILSASGMADAGRIKHHLKHNLWRPESSVLFVGYQAEGTLGRTLIEGAKKVRIHGEDIEVKAQIINVDGLSAHADQKQLLEWLGKIGTKPKICFAVHGEAETCHDFAQIIQTNLDIHALVPHLGQCIKLGIESIDLSAVPTAKTQDIGSLLLDINYFIAVAAKNQDAEKLSQIKDFISKL